MIPFPSLPEKEGGVEIPVPSVSAPVARAEVRAVLPGDRDYVADGAHLERASVSSLVPHAFAAPEGFAVVEAGWTALTSAPKALVIQAKPRKEKRPWF